MTANRTDSGFLPSFSGSGIGSLSASGIPWDGYRDVYSGGSIKLNLTKEAGMATGYAGNNNNSIIEVVLVSADEDGNAEVAFGPKAYAAVTAQGAVVQATADFIADGGDASTVVDARTRFFG